MMPLPRLLFTLLVLGTTLPAAAQYRWTDSSGRVAYGDNPPRDARNVQRIDVAASETRDPALAGLPFELARAAQRLPVTLYTTRDCALCADARNALRSRGIPYTEMTVNSPEEFAAFRQQGGSNRFPALRVGRDILPGLDLDGWNAQLDAASYPRDQLPPDWKARTRSVYEAPPPPPPAAPVYVPLGTGPSN